MRIQAMLYHRIPLSSVAVITKKTKDRVEGYIQYTYGEGRRNFNVKHDGYKFAVGSDSAKQQYYFRNEIKD
jgi:hypothetical protein